MWSIVRGLNERRFTCSPLRMRWKNIPYWYRNPLFSFNFIGLVKNYTKNKYQYHNPKQDNPIKNKKYMIKIVSHWEKYKQQAESKYLSGERVHKASGKSTQTSITQTCIFFLPFQSSIIMRVFSIWYCVYLWNDIFQIDAELKQCSSQIILFENYSTWNKRMSCLTSRPKLIIAFCNVRPIKYSIDKSIFYFENINK